MGKKYFGNKLISPVEAIPAAAYTTTVATSAGIDVSDYDGVAVVLAIGAGGITFSDTNKIEISLTDSDDNSTFVAVADADVPEVTVTSGIIKSLVAAHATAAIYTFTYMGDARYLKVTATFSGTHGTGTPLACSVVRGLSHKNPIA